MIYNLSSKLKNFIRKSFRVITHIWNGLTNVKIYQLNLEHRMRK